MYPGTDSISPFSFVKLSKLSKLSCDMHAVAEMRVLLAYELSLSSSGQHAHIFSKSIIRLGKLDRGIDSLSLMSERGLWNALLCPVKLWTFGSA
jgi:hypothetical protein